MCLQLTGSFGSFRLRCLIFKVLCVPLARQIIYYIRSSPFCQELFSDFFRAASLSFFRDSLFIISASVLLVKNFFLTFLSASSLLSGPLRPPRDSLVILSYLFANVNKFFQKTFIFPFLFSNLSIVPAWRQGSSVPYGISVPAWYAAPALFHFGFCS